MEMENEKRANLISSQALKISLLLFSICVALGVWVWVVNQETRKLTTDGHKLALSNRKLALQGKNAQIALCSFKDDLKLRLDKNKKDLNNTKLVLVKNPHGVLGFSRADLIVSIKTQKLAVFNEQRTYDSLNPYLTCPEDNK